MVRGFLEFRRVHTLGGYLQRMDQHDMVLVDVGEVGTEQFVAVAEIEGGDVGQGDEGLGFRVRS